LSNKTWLDRKKTKIEQKDRRREFTNKTCLKKTIWTYIQSKIMIK
jgi:hypothetical protein